MKILAVSDTEEKRFWDDWNSNTAEFLSAADIVLSAGDLNPLYLEFLVTMMNVPLLYLRGNHDGIYSERPPEGCIDIDGRIADIVYEEGGRVRDVLVHEKGARGIAARRSLTRWMRSISRQAQAETYSTSRSCEASEDCRFDALSEGNCSLTSGEQIGAAPGRLRIYRIAGLGGSMRYRDGDDVFTEDEMSRRIRRLSRGLRMLGRAYGRPAGGEAASSLDMLLTHSPSRGYGDMEDLPHTGYECFNRFMEEFRPSVHLHGHVHMEYGRFGRFSDHSSGTRIINCSGYSIIDL